MSSLIVRIGWIQFVNGQWLKEKASQQQNSDREIVPKRGVIYDRNGKELAISASVDRISASPQELKKSKADVNAVADKLAQILSEDREVILKKLLKNSRYEIIKRKVDREIGKKIKE